MSCSAVACERARPVGILRGRPPTSGTGSSGGWRPSGPLLAQTLRLGYQDQWTRQHRFPAAEFVVNDQGVTATVAAIAGAGLADYQRVADYLADTWGCVSVRAEQRGPGRIWLRGLRRDPLLASARVDLPGTAPASLMSWWLGWAEDASAVFIRSAEVSGMVVGGLAGFGKTMLVMQFIGQLSL